MAMNLGLVFFLVNLNLNEDNKLSWVYNSFRGGPADTNKQFCI